MGLGSSKQSLEVWYTNLKVSLPNKQIDQEVARKLNEIVRAGKLDAASNLMIMHPITVDRGSYENPLRIALENDHEDVSRWLIDVFSFTDDEVLRLVIYLKDTKQYSNLKLLDKIRREIKIRGKEPVE